MQADISRGQYIDPRSGRMTVEDFAGIWRAAQLHRPSTAERVERVLRRRVIPQIGALPLAAVWNAHIKGW